MKKLLSIILAALMLATALASCATVSPTGAAVSANIRLTSSDALDAAAWLSARLEDKLTDSVVIGTNADGYGVALSTLEENGYVIRSLGDEIAILANSEGGLDRAVREYAKAVEKGGAAGIDVTYDDGPRVKKLTIGDADISEFVISYKSAELIDAANEISDLLKLATGVRLSVEETVDADHLIYFEEAPSDKNLGDYGYEYEVKDGSLYIRGSKYGGALNGVWRFLENELDWRGLIYGEAELMPADEIAVPDGTAKSERPAFDYLYAYYNAWGSYDTPRTGYANRNSYVYGRIANACHGMQAHFADCALNQICYTNDDVYEDVYYNVRDYIDDLLKQGYVVGENLLDVDIAQGDNPNYCGCKECRKVYAEEGGNVGAVVRFANRLATQINEEDYKFDAPLYFKIFAYAGTNAPPKKTAPNEYIYVTFCTDMNCSNHLLDGSDCSGTTGVGNRNNKIYAEWLEGWCAICPNMYVWDYALDTVLAQYTVTDTMYHDFKYLADLGVKGIFWQCQFHGLGIQRVEHQLLA